VKNVAVSRVHADQVQADKLRHLMRHTRTPPWTSLTRN
jgi:hypothetical protein